MPQIDLKDCRLYLRDGTSVSAPFGPNEIEVTIGEGNLTYTKSREMIYQRDRGLLDQVKAGDQQPVQLSFDFRWEFLKGGNSPPFVTIEDALKQRGGAASWLSSDTDACQPYSVDLIFQRALQCGADQDEALRFAKFRFETLEHKSGDAQITCTGRANIVTPTALRGASMGELITNGKFRRNASGWSTAGDAALTWQTGGFARFSTSAGGDTNFISQAIANADVELNTVYVLDFDIWNVSASAGIEIEIESGSGTDLEDDQVASDVSEGHKTVQFTSHASEDGLLIKFKMDSGGGSGQFDIDNISLRRYAAP